PSKRFQWKVLPQRMKNSPAICQWFVALALSPVREKFLNCYCYHYMDDILLAAADKEQLNELEMEAKKQLQTFGLIIAPEKVQRQHPWKYLGLQITQHTVAPQPIQLAVDVKTLTDVQKLVGSINWIRPYLGLTNTQLAPLFELLKHSTNPQEPRHLTDAATQALQQVELALHSKFVSRIDPTQEVQLFVLIDHLAPFGLLVQWCDQWPDPLHILEWLFLPFKSLIKARKRCIECTGAEPARIVVPVQSYYFEWCLANKYQLQAAFAGFNGQVSYHFPSHPLLKFFREVPVGQKLLRSPVPLDGLTVFTDGSGKTGKAAVVWRSSCGWQQQVASQTGSPQVVELRAVTLAFQMFHDQPLNVVTDSAYVANLLQQLDHTVLYCQPFTLVFQVLLELWRTLLQRTVPYFVLHVRSHTSLPGFFVEGNARADALVSAAALGPVPNTHQQAVLSHQFFHQGAEALRRQFGLTHSVARSIVSSCPDCHHSHTPVYFGTNPRGLKALEIWQTDVTHIAEFGNLKYVHVSVDTFSHVVVATAHTGEKSRDVVKHFQRAFATFGVPSQVKTDNGPSYVSKAVRAFFALWGVTHVTGIPHSSTGQAIVERMHGTLKQLLQKQ
ncbi:POK11 protein, partial [Piprites chloris]|nr:POK11 protein [Piprites chloris]